MARLSLGLLASSQLPQKHCLHPLLPPLPPCITDSVQIHCPLSTGCGHSSVPCLRLPCSLCATVLTSAPLAPDFLPMPLALFYLTWTWTKSWGLDPFSFPCISSQGHHDHPPALAGLSKSVLTLCVPIYPLMGAGIPEWED